MKRLLTNPLFFVPIFLLCFFVFFYNFWNYVLGDGFGVKWYSVSKQEIIQKTVNPHFEGNLSVDDDKKIIYCKDELEYLVFEKYIKRFKK